MKLRARIMKGRFPRPQLKVARRYSAPVRQHMVVKLGRYAFAGATAWMLRLAERLVNLIGVRNRLFKLTNRAWDYLLLDRAVRLIFPAKRL